MSNARDRRRDYVRGLEGEREAMDSAAHLPQKQGNPIYLPEEEGEVHGQFLMTTDAAGNNRGLNFRALDGGPWQGEDSIAEAWEWLDKLLSGSIPFIEFTSPHDGGTHRMTRAGAEAVIAVCQARTKGVRAPQATDPRTRLVRVPPELVPRHG